jgi:hypothetical protein
VELLISTKQRSNPLRYRDGDVVCAFSAQRILWCRAQIVTKPVGFNGYGLRNEDSVCRRFHHYVSQYMFSRVSLHEVERTDLNTGDTDLIDSTPNSVGEYMNVVDHLANITSQDNHLVFGSMGSEVWFGGSRDVIDYHDLWELVIEPHTDHRHEDNMSWRLSDKEKRSFLSLSFRHEPDHEVAALDHDTSCHCDHCHNDLGDHLCRSEEDEDGNLTRKRVCSVPYWDMDGLDVDSIRNPDMESDHRVTPEEGRPRLDDCVSEGV